MRSAQQRIDAYNARMQSSLIDPTLTAVNATQQARHTAHVNVFYPKQLLLRDYMNLNGYFGNGAFKLEAFNGECYAIARSFDGPAAVVQCGVLVAKYTSLGCQAAALKEIALQVWGWIVP